MQIVFKGLCLYGIIALFFLILKPFGSTVALDAAPVVDLTTSPENRFIEVDNLKPGDYMTRSITVNNEGNQDVNYVMTSQKQSGSDLLFEQLDLSVADDKTTLYQGKMHEFDGFRTQSLDVNGHDELQVTVEFPAESGNEFQNLTTDVLFQFLAEEQTDTTPSDPGQPDEGLGNPGDDTMLPNGLPQTGEEPQTLFYILGGMIFAIGISILVIARQKELLGRSIA
ncbi:LPXTG-motif cell wall-anchored protein [Salibacterium salarium]|uniref:TasA family protein n=1 Tax=Salibacterium salarium TaxID=284579 RepID=UPI00278AF7F5|nr:TasA family protein [Salibacterium salarium]MDQ0297783.1 LPXTG-motif cell wall-anchored protein [Salibacterium salarium]